MELRVYRERCADETIAGILHIEPHTTVRDLRFLLQVPPHTLLDAPVLAVPRFPPSSPFLSPPPCLASLPSLLCSVLLLSRCLNLSSFTASQTELGFACKSEEELALRRFECDGDAADPISALLCPIALTQNHKLAHTFFPSAAHVLVVEQRSEHRLSTSEEAVTFRFARLLTRRPTPCLTTHALAPPTLAYPTIRPLKLSSPIPKSHPTCLTPITLTPRQTPGCALPRPDPQQVTRAGGDPHARCFPRARA